MKKLFIASIFVLSFCIITFAQLNETSPCPTIFIKTPADTIQPGETIALTANFENKDAGKFNYNSTVSIGTIIEGRETASINVITTPDLEGQNVTATVEIKGLPSGCPNTSSEIITIAKANSFGCSFPADEDGKLPPQDEKARLSNIAFQLTKDPDFVAVFIIGVTKIESYASIRNRVNRISKHLAESEKIPNDRFRIVFSEDETYRTTIYLLPSDLANSFPGVTDDLELLKPERKPIIKKSKGS